ncbi:hypothetical protein PCE1_002071 [Barthelona sp. PCE]
MSQQSMPRLNPLIAVELCNHDCTELFACVQEIPGFNHLAKDAIWCRVLAKNMHNLVRIRALILQSTHGNYSVYMNRYHSVESKKTRSPLDIIIIKTWRSYHNIGQRSALLKYMQAIEKLKTDYQRIVDVNNDIIEQ